MTEGPSRKLAVILHADVVGSTRLVQQNETLAHERIQDGFRRFSKTIEAYGGTTHEIRGDALVAEFGRASDAVLAAIAFQIENTQFISALEGEIQPWLRVGIAMGEVIIADNSVTGAGVVLAQRLEQLADPGGVCIQGAVHETVPRRFPFHYRDLGEQQVKGFDEFVRAYTVTAKEGEAIPPPEREVSTEAPGLSLPDKPSIAVLPFDNLSNDLSQEYFADGMVEEIITAISRYRWFFVIARNSTFTYKGKTVDPKQVGKELGVRYVMAGSVRRAGQRVRITAQLTDAATGNNIWAEHYDGILEDVFDLQDRISESVAGIIEPNLLQQEGNRAQRELPENLDAYDCYLRALQHDYSVTKEDSAAGVQLLRQAIEMDPNYPAAKSLLARLCVHRVSNGWSEARAKDEAEAVRLAREAVALARDDPTVLAQAGYALGFAGKLEEANALLDRSLALNPNSSRAWTFGGFVSMFSGSPEIAIERFHRATRLSPLDPAAWSYFYGLGLAHLILGNDERAIEWAEKSLRERRGYPGALRVLAAANAQLGRSEAAQIARKRLSGVTAEQSISELRQFRGFQAPIYERYYNGLSKAGFPE